MGCPNCGSRNLDDAAPRIRYYPRHTPPRPGEGAAFLGYHCRSCGHDWDAAPGTSLADFDAPKTAKMAKMAENTYTAQDAIEMMRQGGVNLRRELSNIEASYMDCLDEIAREGGTADFDFSEFETVLRAAASAFGP